MNMLVGSPFYLIRSMMYIVNSCLGKKQNRDRHKKVLVGPSTVPLISVQPYSVFKHQETYGKFFFWKKYF
uniref:Uncharacterized protein n=1 Tax=Arundo donax TaxID=35708 RepID=A0A0A8YI47_ARUDO